jgi:tetratricopeptide (TPR) repeat protein
MVSQTAWFLAAATPLAKVGAAYIAAGDAQGAAKFLTKATAANPKLPAADLLVLALAQAKLLDTDEATKACAKAAELLKSAGTDAPLAALRPLLREVAVTLGTNHAQVQELIAAAAGEPPAALNEAIEKDPDKAVGYKSRGNWYGERGRWKEAIADLADEFRLEPNAHAGMRLGFLLVQAGNTDRHQTHCQAALERWASTDNPSEANQTLKMVLLRPDFKADARQLARLAEVSVSGDQTAPLFEWKLNAKGLHDYRTGKYADALTACRESRRRAPESKGPPQTLIALNLVIEAMALHRSDDATGARRILVEAKAALDGHVPGIDTAAWHDWLAAHILFREAEGLIASKKSEK